MAELKSLVEQISDTLLSDIMRGALQADQKLSVSALCKQWATDEKTVRDALSRLLHESCLEERDGEYYVIAMGRKDFEEIAELRMTLELQAAMVAVPQIPEQELDEALDIYRRAESIEDDFERHTYLLKHDAVVHELLAKYCSNERMRSMLTVMRDLNSWMRHTIIARIEQACEQALPEHMIILEAMKERNIQRVQTLLRNHLERAFQSTLAELDRAQEQPPEDPSHETT